MIYISSIFQTAAMARLLLWVPILVRLCIVYSWRYLVLSCLRIWLETCRYFLPTSLCSLYCRSSCNINSIVFIWRIDLYIPLEHSDLIWRLKTYLQSITVRVEEWRLKQRDTEEWMRHRQLPHELRERVRRFIQYKWLATRGVNEESILQALPADLRRDIKRHLCLGLVRRVNSFMCFCICAFWANVWNCCLMVLWMMDDFTVFLYVPNFEKYASHCHLPVSRQHFSPCNIQ